MNDLFSQQERVNTSDLFIFNRFLYFVNGLRKIIYTAALVSTLEILNLVSTIIWFILSKSADKYLYCHTRPYCFFVVV